MSDLEQLFKQAVKSTRKNKGKFTLMIGTVKSIDNDTCIVDDYEDVRLNAIDDSLNSQFTIYPKKNSKVIIGRIEGEDDCFIVKCSEIDKVVIKIGNQIFEMKDGKFTIKKGSISLKSILDKTLDKLKTSSIIVSGVPGTFSPQDIAFFEQIKSDVSQIFN